MTPTPSRLLDETIARIRLPDAELAAETQRRLDAKTKPPGSLGRLEELACRFAAIRGDTSAAPPRKAMVVMGADHGVAEELVSAYPQEVTAQMLLNFARGGAAINVLARQMDTRVVVVDMGVKSTLPPTSEIRSLRVAAGTENFTRGPAMTRAQAIQAVEAGIGVAGELAAQGITLIGIGDMGIGNTTASSALAAAFTGAPPEEVVGRGTGVDEAGLRRKVEVVRRALALHRPDPDDGLGTLAQLGGFEIAGLAGVLLGAVAARLPVVIDGFICGAAALAATRIAPLAAASLIASHRSVEAGHRAVLKAIGQHPLLDLDLRLGEGTGAVLAMNLIDAALAIVREMATFASAGVSDRG